MAFNKKPHKFTVILVDDSGDSQLHHVKNPTLNRQEAIAAAIEQNPTEYMHRLSRPLVFLGHIHTV